MAHLLLSDGRKLPVVKPHIGDQMELERQMRATRKGYGPAEFREDLKLASFSQAFSIFATLNRAGIKTHINEVLELDMGDLGDLVKPDPEDMADEPEANSEGEQSPDPQPARTGDSPAEGETATAAGPSSTD